MTWLKIRSWTQTWTWYDFVLLLLAQVLRLMASQTRPRTATIYIFCWWPLMTSHCGLLLHLGIRDCTTNRAITHQLLHSLHSFCHICIMHFLFCMSQVRWVHLFAKPAVQAPSASSSVCMHATSAIAACVSIFLALNNEYGAPWKQTHMWQSWSNLMSLYDLMSHLYISLPMAWNIKFVTDLHLSYAHLWW